MKALSKLLLLLAVAGCAPKLRNAASGEKVKTFTVWFRAETNHVRGMVREPVDSVWQVLPAAFQFLHFPGAPSVYADDFVYLTPSLKVEHRLYEGESNSLYLNCGYTPAGVPAADAYEVIFAMLARLTPAPGQGTEIEIIVDGTARNMAERSDPVSCTGTGRLEATILQRVEELLRSKAR